MRIAAGGILCEDEADWFVCGCRLQDGVLGFGSTFGLAVRVLTVCWCYVWRWSWLVHCCIGWSSAAALARGDVRGSPPMLRSWGSVSMVSSPKGVYGVGVVLVAG